MILTGASGVGKTAIAEAIEALDSGIAVYQGDKIGLPSQEILASFGPAEGPGGASQRGFALHWIGQFATQLHAGRPVLLETQCRIAFLQEAVTLHRVSRARIILVECNDHTRNERLIHQRRQPELANTMTNWSRYLHQEARGAGYEVLDTSNAPLAETAALILSYLRKG